MVKAPVVEDERYVLEIRYDGTPRSVAAPTTRKDAALVGWTTMSDGSTWTMQEPFGAYSWYAVNDHPSDKALYDFTLRVANPMVGVANGELESRERVDGQTVTEWHLAEPAASYLVTVAFGDFVTADRHLRGRGPGQHLAAAPRRGEGGRPARDRGRLRWSGPRTGSVPTPSTRSVSSSSTPPAAWRPRP